MLDLICSSCNNRLDINYSDTLSTFLEKVNYLDDSIDDIKKQASNIYIEYFCSFCDIHYNYTLEEVFDKFIERVVYDVKNYRKIHIFKNYINPTIINPDSGMVFCGQCTGIDNLGNCYLDIQKQCPFKRTTL